MTFWIIAGVGFIFILFIIGLMKAASREAPQTPMPQRKPYVFVVCPTMVAFDYWCRMQYGMPVDNRRLIAVTPQRVKQGSTRGLRWQEGDEVAYEACHLISVMDQSLIAQELRMMGVPK